MSYSYVHTVVMLSLVALHALHRIDQVKMTECVAYTKTRTHTSGSIGVEYDDGNYV